MRQWSQWGAVGVSVLVLSVTAWGVGELPQAVPSGSSPAPAVSAPSPAPPPAVPPAEQQLYAILQIRDQTQRELLAVVQKELDATQADFRRQEARLRREGWALTVSPQGQLGYTAASAAPAAPAPPTTAGTKK